MEYAAAYIRVSTREQKLHGLSLDAQKMKLTDYAKSHQLHIVHWYMDEGVSGRKKIRQRPQLQQMIQDCETGQFSRILFIKLDRYFRSVAEYHECQKILDAHRVTWTATEEQYDLTSANGRAFVNMKLTIAELEADQTGERVRLVNDFKIRQGMPLYGAQCLPFCFTITIKDGHKRVVQNAKTSAATYALIEHFLTHQSLQKTLIYARSAYNLQTSYGALKRLFTNPMLYGCYHGINDYCEAYIDKSTFDKIQSIFQRGQIKSGKRRCYLFSGLFICPCCGWHLSGHATKAKLANGHVKYYKEYKCNRHKKEKSCAYSHTLSEQKLERYLLEYIDNFETKTMFFTSIEKFLKKYYYSEQTLPIQSTSPNTSVKPNTLNISSDNWKEVYNKLKEEHKRAFWKSLIQYIELDEMRISTVYFFNIL